MRITEPDPVSRAPDTEEDRAPAGPPSEDEIRALVHDFYGAVREDDLLGPIFAERIDAWPPHLERMCAFWSGILRASGRYRGNPLEAHASIPGLEAHHFGRWLALFQVSAARTLSPGAARDVVARAGRMSRVLLRNRSTP